MIDQLLSAKQQKSATPARRMRGTGEPQSTVADFYLAVQHEMH